MAVQLRGEAGRLQSGCSARRPEQQGAASQRTAAQGPTRRGEGRRAALLARGPTRAARLQAARGRRACADGGLPAEPAPLPCETPLGPTRLKLMLCAQRRAMPRFPAATQARTSSQDQSLMARGGQAAALARRAGGARPEGRGLLHLRGGAPREVRDELWHSFRRRIQARRAGLSQMATWRALACYIQKPANSHS